MTMTLASAIRSRLRTPAFLSRLLDAIQERTRNWDLRRWFLVGILAQILSIALYQWISDLIPHRTGPAPEISMVPEMSFVEFQEVHEATPAESQELSDKIIETEKMTKEKPVNWQNAADPAMDFDQRYSARLLVSISPDDYPSRARRASIGVVVVAVSLYIDASGKIRDVRIRNIRSEGDAAAPFKEEFMEAVRKILLEKTKLLNNPYRKSGEAHDFIWDTTVTFTLQ